MSTPVPTTPLPHLVMIMEQYLSDGRRVRVERAIPRCAELHLRVAEAGGDMLRQVEREIAIRCRAP